MVAAIFSLSRNKSHGLYFSFLFFFIFWQKISIEYKRLFFFFFTLPFSLDRKKGRVFFYVLCCKDSSSSSSSWRLLIPQAARPNAHCSLVGVGVVPGTNISTRRALDGALITSSQSHNCIDENMYTRVCTGAQSNGTCAAAAAALVPLFFSYTSGWWWWYCAAHSRLLLLLPNYCSLSHLLFPLLSLSRLVLDISTVVRWET